jgi:hypothetical protein
VWLAAAGCGSQDALRPPVPASGATGARFAVGYAGEIERRAALLEDGLRRLGERTAELGRTAPLKDPTDRERAAEILRAADRAGQSAIFDERARDAEAARGLLHDAGGEIPRRLAGSVQHYAHEHGCDENVGPVAATSLKTLVERRLEERAREANEAHALVDRHEIALGKANEPALRKLADEIASGSRQAHLELPRALVELRRMLGDRSAVERTLASELDDEEDAAERQAPTLAGAAARQAAALRDARKVRIAELRGAQERIGPIADKLQASLVELDRRVRAAAAAWDDAVGDLSDAVENGPAK